MLSFHNWFNVRLFITFLLATAVCILAPACGSSSKKSQQTTIPTTPRQGKTVVKEHPSGNNTGTSANNTGNTKPNQTEVITTPNTDKVYIPDPISNLDTTSSIPVIPGTFKIAVMLPFNAHRFYPNITNDSIPDNSVLAVEFYEGLQIALDHLRQKGHSLEVQVFDTENNTGKVSQILGEPFVKQANLILGPVYNNQLKTVAQFAKQNKIYQVSPLSPSPKITVNNPYYLVASPSIETHCVAMFDYIMNNFGEKRIIAANSGKASEISLGRLFSSLAGNYEDEGDGAAYININQITIYNEDDELAIEPHLSPTEENILIITSFNELFINDAMRKLSLLRDRYRITLFGMPNWMKMETLDFEYLVNLNFHVTSPLWIDDYNPEHMRFKQDYYSRYYTKPGNYAVAGYSLMTFFGKALRNYGIHLGDQLANSHISTPYTRYNFQPAMDNQYRLKMTRTDFLENKYVNILKYTSNYTLEKVD